MKKFLFAFLLMILGSGNSFSAEPIHGIWKTIDDETGEAKSLVQIYEYDGKYYGRVIKLFKNSEAKAKDIKGSPKIDGLDIIWEMREDDDRFSGGKILDPKKGKIYTCEIWRDDNGSSLVVRGKIGPFGRNQKWILESETEAKAFIPSIPEEE